MTPKLDAKARDFIEAYNDYYPLIYSVVYSKVMSVEDAKDISQDVFMRFFEKQDEVENPRKWLLGTLRNVVFEHYRKKKDSVDVDELFEDISMSFVNGFRDTRLLIAQALEDMNNYKDERERILFELVAVNNFTYKEAGAELGLTERQVRYKYGNIVSRLLQYFERKGIKSLEELL